MIQFIKNPGKKKQYDIFGIGWRIESATPSMFFQSTSPWYGFSLKNLGKTKHVSNSNLNLDIKILIET